MRIGVISDVHSDLGSLETALSNMGDVDLLMCAGDLVGYGNEPNEVVERLSGLVSHAVTGNHDAAVVSSGPERDYWKSWMNSTAWKRAEANTRALTEDNARYVRNLPVSDRFEAAGASILLVHGSPSEPLTDYVYEDTLSERLLDRWFPNGDRPDVIIHGHTHVPYTARIGDTRIVNPGSVSIPRIRGARRSYAIIDMDRDVTPVLRYFEPSGETVLETS